MSKDPNSSSSFTVRPALGLEPLDSGKSNRRMKETHGGETRAKRNLEEAQAKLPELIEKLAPGEELVITRNNQPLAKLVLEKPPVRKPRQPGSAKGKLIIQAEDEQHLEDFKEYME